MRSSGAPFLINIYPFLTRVQNRSAVPLDNCLFTAGTNHWVQDGNYTYKNIFDGMIDALHIALGKIGYGDFEIAIGESGWPTAGGEDATISNAAIFLRERVWAPLKTRANKYGVLRFGSSTRCRIRWPW